MIRSPVRGLFGAERSGLRILMLPGAVGACRLVLVVHFGCYQLSRAQTTRIGSAHLPLEEKTLLRVIPLLPLDRRNLS